MPCALLLGQELADMSPLDLAQHVRQLAGPDFPILLVSEHDWAQIEYRATRAGVNAFVPCHLFPSRLLETLSALTSGGGEDSVSADSQEMDYSDSRVLLVEDNELNLEIAMELLGFTGVQVETAGDGAQALEKFQQSPEGYYDLILTANAFMEDVRRSRDAGMNEHISKPVDVDRLFEILRSRLKPKAAQG